MSLFISIKGFKNSVCETDMVPFTLRVKLGDIAQINNT